MIEEDENVAEFAHANYAEGQRDGLAAARDLFAPDTIPWLRVQFLIQEMDSD